MISISKNWNFVYKVLKDALDSNEFTEYQQIDYLENSDTIIANGVKWVYGRDITDDDTMCFEFSGDNFYELMEELDKAFSSKGYNRHKR